MRNVIDKTQIMKMLSVTALEDVVPLQRLSSDVVLKHNISSSFVFHSFRKHRGCSVKQIRVNLLFLNHFYTTNRNVFLDFLHYLYHIQPQASYFARKLSYKIFRFIYNFRKHTLLTESLNRTGPYKCFQLYGGGS